LSCARRRRLRCLPRPAASRSAGRRSRGLEVHRLDAALRDDRVRLLAQPVSERDLEDRRPGGRRAVGGGTRPRRCGPGGAGSRSPHGRSMAPSELSSTSSTSAAERACTPAAAAEDDVLHRLSAHASGDSRPSAQHRVGHVRLARAVGADDHRTPRGEVEALVRSEGLEALEGQRLGCIRRDP
jgi:hypothetical protein